jgi:hypothetical protein
MQGLSHKLQNPKWLQFAAGFPVAFAQVREDACIDKWLVNHLQEDAKRIFCPQIRAFNSVLTTACTFDEVEVGVCCMGIIELAFADISAIIGKTVVQRGWILEKDLVHYKLHAEIDTRHAKEFFKVVEKQWENPQKQYLIKQGLELGAYIFDRL